ncbi:MAG: hypothetical protein HY553_05340 [Elusimicrobia bacterium]|nr:hypothetical protein [Elusimicrobiota bacterium]
MIAAVVAVLLAAPAAAGVSAGGYLKNLYDYTRAPLSERPYWSDLSRARVTLEAKRGPVVAHADYDHELRVGSFLNTPDYRLTGLREPASYFDMEQTISTGNSYLYRHRLYRAWAAVEGEAWTVRFGRQRIAWGSGKIWNPTDVLNPFEPTSLERDERRGVDAVYARRGLGSLGQAEAAWALADRWAATDLLGRARGHLGSADAAVVGGKVAGSTGSWLAGGDVSADLWEGNAHAEWTYTNPGTRTSYWRVMLGYEYTLSADHARPLRELSILAEYYHNGRGETDPARYQPALLSSGREVALARDYLGLGLQQELHPLVNAELHQVLNLNDDSHFLNASVAWNAVKNVYLTAGLQRFAGSRRSELGRAANRVYAQAQYFF